LVLKFKKHYCETEFYCVAQAVLKLLSLSDPPASDSQAARTTDNCPHSQLRSVFNCTIRKKKTVRKTFSFCVEISIHFKKNPLPMSLCVEFNYHLYDPLLLAGKTKVKIILTHLCSAGFSFDLVGPGS
jgi:hypothetical protein